jgi:predicted RNA-binding Zn ribbon-like protein
MSQEQVTSKFILIGNHPCLDFINTEIIQAGERVNLLVNFADLVQWLVMVQILDSAKGEEIIKRWDRTAEGQQALEQALVFRALLRELVEGVVAGKPAPPATITEINRWLHHRIRYSQLIQADNGFVTRSVLEFDQAVQLLAPVAEAASDLLSNTDFSLLKKCENPACILYYYDTTKNRARRWCSPHLCGNRMKVAAYYRRHRQKETITQP